MDYLVYHNIQINPSKKEHIIMLKHIYWKNWQEEHKQIFFRHIFWGIIITVFMQFSYVTGFGQDLLNKTYDSMLMRFFIKHVQKPTIPKNIRMIIFDKDSYEHSSSMGFWTPRVLLCKSIIQAIRMGAKVVVVDFALDRPVPFQDENKNYIKCLAKAAQLAEEQQAVIVMPHSKKNYQTTYFNEYMDLLNKYSEVIKTGVANVYKHQTDRMIRHFIFYEKNDNITFSIPVLATVFYWYGRQKGEQVLKQKADEISNNSKSYVKIEDPSHQHKIYLYHQSSITECMAARFVFRSSPKGLIQKLPQGGYFPESMIISANDINKSFEENGNYHPIDPSWAKNKIVLIGSYYQEIGDIHSTPIGNMPGIYLILNSIQMLISGSQIYELNLFIKILLILPWILVASIVFTYISGFWATFIFIGLIYLLFSPFSTYLFIHFGIFMDFWLPVTIMGFREYVGILEPLLIKLGRACLKINKRFAKIIS
jgi:CHASE2 domain-containing sensor protein